MRFVALVVWSVLAGCSEYGMTRLPGEDAGVPGVQPVEAEEDDPAADVPADSPSEAPTDQPDPPAQPEPPAEEPDPPAEEPDAPVPPVVQDAQPGDLVFSELMINPEAVADDVGEWVELYNTSGYPIDVSGYAFHDLDYDSWVLTGPFIVPPGGYYVLCAEMSPDLNGGVPCDGWFQRVSLGGGLALANLPDEVVLTRPDGVEIDRLEYDEGWFTNGVAMGVDPSALDPDANDAIDSWCDQVTVVATDGEPGTPGQPNDPCW